MAGFHYLSQDQSVLKSRLLYLEQIRNKAFLISTLVGFITCMGIKYKGIQAGRFVIPCLTVGTTMYGLQYSAHKQYRQAAQGINRKYTDILNQAMFFEQK